MNKVNTKTTTYPVHPGDVFRTCADISKIRKILKFEPKVDFEGGLKHTVEWFKSKQGLSPAKSNSENIKRTLPASVVYKGK